ncbi:MAG TPA: prolyl oligopeptidase family serine peptidase [Vicinamibacterales bacterium]|nr:prolyl oligopeptidase family serine peptidase [Vicinamibacterales bacterium]
MKIASVAALALCFQFVLTHAPVALAQEPAAQPAPPAPGRGRGPVPADPRAQIRTYRFADTNEDIPYAIYVSSKVSRDKKNPLILTLHGLGGTHTTMMRAAALDLAEAGGYIYVAPMGYNPRGWYGVPAGPRRGGPPPNAAANPGRQGPPRGAPAGANDPPNLRELSEKDVLNVLEAVRKEFDIDERRTYLFGHSMGGAGTYHLAVKYPEKWAAIGVQAPAAFSLDPNSLSKIPTMPVIVIHGDMDTAVPVTLSRTWVEVMKTLKMPYQYIEVAGGDHGSVISGSMPDIFAFFATHSKPAIR